jgi:molybdopterin-guanine dinucleotide biosynthesis protein A
VSRSRSSSSAGTPEAAASASRARASHSSMPADSVTGLLLVGGESRRFGSPKALARFEGETLAERGWRALGWCGERLAVGRLELPFPVLPDAGGAEAPIAGVVAGLRVSRNEVCLVLPVDCPLVTEGALRALAAARAVPQTGPLPGAYTKAMLPELERRLAGGDLTLRGVNDTVLALDPELLVDVDTKDELRRLARPAGR